MKRFPGFRKAQYRVENLEAASGIEPLKRVLQTLALATWLRRREEHELEGLEAIKLEGCKATKTKSIMLESWDARKLESKTTKNSKSTANPVTKARKDEATKEEGVV